VGVVTDQSLRELDTSSVRQVSGAWRATLGLLRDKPVASKAGVGK